MLHGIAKMAKIAGVHLDAFPDVEGAGGMVDVPFRLLGWGDKPDEDRVVRFHSNDRPGQVLATIGNEFCNGARLGLGLWAW